MKNLLPEWVDRLSGSRYRATIWFERYFSWGMRASSELEPVSEDRFRDALGSVPVRVPSSELAMKLRVLASRESQRRRLEPSWTLRLYKWRDELRLQINNVARPFAIPTAGGFLSAFLLFGLLGPTLEVPGSVAKANDIPTGLYTEASVKTLMPVGFEERELLIEITVDGNGRVVDHSYLPDGDQPVPEDVRRRVQGYLLFTEFNPARSFGQPTSGKLRLSFQSRRITVKG